MALKRSEKILGSAFLIGLGGVIFFVSALPQWDQLSKNMQQKTDLETQNKTLELEKTSLLASVQKLTTQLKLPTDDIKVPQVTADNAQQVVKNILDRVVSYAAGKDNKVISLKPWPDVPALDINPPAPEKPEDGKDAKPATADASKEAAPPPAELPVNLQTVGYELAVRGTYQSIQDFLLAMDAQKEMVEVSSITIANEAGADRAGGKGAVTGQDIQADTARPIRLVAKLRLILEQK